MKGLGKLLLQINNYSKKNKIMATITTVTAYLDLIKGIEIENNVFFRGHSDDKYDLNPGI